MNLVKYNTYSVYIEKLQSYTEECFWENCKQNNDFQIFKKYLEEFPAGKYKDEVIRKAWETAYRQDTIRAYEAFLEYFPDSPFKEEAIKRLEKFKKEVLKLVRRIIR